MLETAFKMLSHSRTAVIDFDEENCSILELAIEVAFKYIKKITSTRRQFVQQQTIPNSPFATVAKLFRYLFKTMGTLLLLDFSYVSSSLPTSSLSCSACQPGPNRQWFSIPTNTDRLKPATPYGPIE